ncbi:hypothetical protein E4U14_008174 [Claviceps sp. LM454 group G7]|nr:hypothetical protein E4U14_008174 [Claviceps sp. LM454 group G7]
MYHVSSEGVRHDTRRRECSECDDSDEASATGRDEMLRVVVDLTTLEMRAQECDPKYEPKHNGGAVLELSNSQARARNEGTRRGQDGLASSAPQNTPEAQTKEPERRTASSALLRLGLADRLRRRCSVSECSDSAIVLGPPRIVSFQGRIDQLDDDGVTQRPQ